MRIEELVYGTRGNETYLTLVLRKCELEDVKNLEARRAVYMMYNKQGEVMYVGETASLRRRVYEHLTPNTGKKEITRETVSYIEYAYIQVDRYERAIMEGLLVNKYQPILNCDDSKSRERSNAIPQDLFNDILFYTTKTNLSNKVIAKALGTYDVCVANVRANGLSTRTSLPNDFVPSVVITDEMAEQLGKRDVLNKEDFIAIRDMLESGQYTRAEIAAKFGGSTATISNINNLKLKKYKEWEKERLTKAS
jgi:predicted GIY-YIG superfamily endonuclease